VLFAARHGAAKDPGASSDNQAVTGSAFRFRLERVRAVRERNETTAKQELAQAISRRSRSEAALRTADAHMEHAQHEQRAMVDGTATITATELMARQAFLERVEVQHAQSVRELSQRDAEVVERDARLATAATEHEMLNQLRERQRGEHAREADRKEQGSLDEIATQRFGRSTA
jgi:flagellar export protein FliJ